MTRYFTMVMDVLRFMVLVLSASIITACATNTVHVRGDERIYHSFKLNKGEFDGQAGVSRVQLLDYLYGNPQGYAAKNPEQYRKRGECEQGTSGFLNMPRKDIKMLFVKWRDNVTGEVHEVTLDLNKKLPADFGENHEIFASFKEGQLYVYLITPERRPADMLPNGPRATAYLKTIALYPEQ